MLLWYLNQPIRHKTYLLFVCTLNVWLVMFFFIHLAVTVASSQTKPSQIMGETGGVTLSTPRRSWCIGLYNKIDAYPPSKRRDVHYEANNHLGFGDDLRISPKLQKCCVLWVPQKIRLRPTTLRKSTNLKSLVLGDCRSGQHFGPH